MFIALTGWFPTYWKNLFGVNELSAGALTAVYSILASLVRIGGGIMADRIGGQRALLASLMVTLFGALGMTFTTTFAPAVVAMILLALGMGVANAAVFKLVPQYVSHAVGGAAGWIGGLGAFGGFAIPPLMAWIAGSAGSHGYALGFAVFIVLALLSLAVTFLLKARPLTAAEPSPS